MATVSVEYKKRIKNPPKSEVLYNLSTCKITQYMYENENIY